MDLQSSCVVFNGRCTLKILTVVGCTCRPLHIVVGYKWRCTLLTVGCNAFKPTLIYTVVGCRPMLTVGRKCTCGSTLFTADCSPMILLLTDCTPLQCCNQLFGQSESCCWCTVYKIKYIGWDIIFWCFISELVTSLMYKWPIEFRCVQ